MTENIKKSCPRKGCLYKFNETNLKFHIQCHSKNMFQDESGEIDRSFVCPESGCEDSKFSQWRRCAMHLWQEHQIDIGLLTCSVCHQFKTVIPAKLQNHKLIHNDQKVFKCGACDKTFSQLSQLRNHAVTHLDKDSEKVPQWYAKKQCDICQKYFSDSKCLKKHVQAVHSKLKPYICHICNHQSARKAMLEMHMRQHTGEKPYQCDKCDYKTGDHNSLRRHRMGHDGSKPYKCPYCEYASIQSYAFKQHVMKKHPDKQQAIVFACQQCQYKSISPESFATHIQSSHESAKAVNEDAPSTSREKMSQAVKKGDQEVYKDQSQLPTSTITEKDSKLLDSKKSKTDLPQDEDSLHATTDLGGTTIPAV